MGNPGHGQVIDYNVNWTFAYVLVALIPAVFVAVVLYSRRRDHVVKKKADTEMALHGQTYNRSWFPWREAIFASEGQGSANTVAGPPYRPDTTRQPPVVPQSFAPKPQRTLSKNNGPAAPTRKPSTAAEKGKGKEMSNSIRREEGLVNEPNPYRWGAGIPNPNNYGGPVNVGGSRQQNRNIDQSGNSGNPYWPQGLQDVPL